MATKYAQGTEVSSSRSREEIEHTLKRFGAGKQLWARDDDKSQVTVAFERQRRTYRLTITMPPKDSPKFTETPSGKWSRTPKQAEKAFEQEQRRLFRSLAQYIKALLVAVDDGIISAEEALLPYMMLPGGKTVSEEVEANIDRVLAGAPALPMLEGPK